VIRLIVISREPGGELHCFAGTCSYCARFDDDDADSEAFDFVDGLGEFL
jgi:hypothetical protein